MSGVKHPDERARELVAHVFPLITAKLLEEGKSDQILWAYKGAKGACV